MYARQENTISTTHAKTAPTTALLANTTPENARHVDRYPQVLKVHIYLLLWRTVDAHAETKPL